jgi:CubicO group peptidase (beta-lactamase class C family)
MRAVHVSSIFAIALAACGSGPPQAAPRAAPIAAPMAAPASVAVPAVDASAPAPAAARQLAADATIATPSGATFLAPQGFWITEASDRIALEDPDRALTVTLIELGEPDAAKAIAAAWQRVEPGFARVPLEPDQPPPTGGWDRVTRVDYETPADEHRAVSAVARRWGGTTYVALLDGEAAAVARRDAQIRTALGTFTPKGMHEESFAGRSPRLIDDARAAEIDAFVVQALARLAVPGAAVAVIEGGKVVYERTFGVRELGKPAKVTPRTLFLIASITKPMTTMMEAALVDAGTFAWDTPITKLLPAFALGDLEVTQKVAMWHTSCACTGMPRQDLEDIFEYGDVTPELRIASMKTMKPTTGFGETFQYSNLMVAAGGFAAAHAYAPGKPLGAAYDAAMRAMIFAPIGMTSTTLDFRAVARADHASPHARAIDGDVRVLPLAIERDVLPIAPAGAVWTSVHDLERFAMTELGGGMSPGGVRVMSAAGMRERRTMRVRSDEEGGYGLGLGVGTFHGLPTIGHDGGAFGFGTMMFLLPEQNIAILVLTNVRNGGAWQQLPFNEAVQRKIVEEIFDGKDRAADLVTYYAKMQRASAAKAAAGVERSPAAAWIAHLAGTYKNASLGTVTIRAAVHGGTFDAGEWRTGFGRRTRPDGITALVFLDPPFAGSELLVTGDAAHPALTIPYGQETYVFERATP